MGQAMAGWSIWVCLGIMVIIGTLTKFYFRVVNSPTVGERRRIIREAIFTWVWFLVVIIVGLGLALARRNLA